MNQTVWENNQNRQSSFFQQTEICTKNLALANVNYSISDIRMTDGAKSQKIFAFVHVTLLINDLNPRVDYLGVYP